MTLAAVALDDKYALESGRVFLTGTQALVRLPMLQRRRDDDAGRKTGVFVSGYRGSPLGGYDKALWQARAFLARHDIHFQPGVNEDLAATAVWGSQQLGMVGPTRYDGVVGIWYGKGPGVDRCGDAIRHANSAGTARHGGVLMLLGDDHGAKSSTLPHQSDFAMVDAMIPVLHPAGVQEFLDLGLHGIAASRFSGLWTGFKCVTAIVDSSATASVDPARVDTALPEDFAMPEGGLNIRWPDDRFEAEERLHEAKLAAFRAYARRNRLDRIAWDSPQPRIGVAASGKSWLDVMQALDDLGVDSDMAAALGLRLYKIALAWPLEPEGLRRFADGLEEIVVVEEKRGLIEDQVKSLLYGAARAPVVVGKRDEAGAPLFPAARELSADHVAQVLARRLAARGGAEGLPARLSNRAARIAAAAAPPESGGAKVLRTPYFCSGCPHNTSTRVPEGSRALSGIGCHFMAQSMDRNTATYSQMGGEGAPWIGQAPFADEDHVFVNIGDGTYFHSGLLAVRAAVAAGVNATYKILYNDAVAMTGGQPIDGSLSVAQITHQLHGEGVKTIAVVADDPGKYPVGADFARGVRVHPRAELDSVQRALRAAGGVTALIYDQVCATEKRRRRKRGRMADPARWTVINDLVCEGCGDCSTASNCVSVEPLETPFGRKRQIDLSTCNKDFSCVDGFCPSFVTVEGGALRKAAARAAAPDPSSPDWGPLPEPAIAESGAPANIVVAGIGGTGVVTIGAVLGMAAHIAGKACTVLDSVGAAQKGGAVLSQIRIAAAADRLHALAIGRGRADLLLGCDVVVAAGRDALSRLDAERAAAVVNTHNAPVAAFVRDPDIDFARDANRALVARAAAPGKAEFVDATALAVALFGDAIAGNMLLLGLAWQKGLVPVPAAAIERAIDLNGVAAAMNRAAFAWGRRAALDPAAAMRAARAGSGADASGADEAEADDDDLDRAVARRAAFLADYQDAAYAARYRAIAARARAAEAALPGESERFARAVARGAFKLMAYKDEYEVARLHADRRFLDSISARFSGRYRLKFHLAPPLFARRDPATGRLVKRAYGPWLLPVFRVLAALRRLRGTPFDVFGHTRERREERALAAGYAELVEELAGALAPGNHALACELAELPERIRGYGHVKARALAEARALEAEKLAAFRGQDRIREAAE